MKKPLVLLVEDEAVMRRVLTLALRSNGYDTIQAGTGREALTSIRSNRPDAIILDLGLPDMDGVDVARAAYQDYQVPIVVLSARSDEQEQIRALDVGADDYVTKPFREGELMARLRAALRRAHGSTRDELSSGDIKLDFYDRRVTVGARQVSLTPIEFKLLQVLASGRGRVVTHERLLKEVWGPRHVGEVQYLRVYMKQLRRKIEEEPARPKRILTVLGIGYKLAPVSGEDQTEAP